MRLRAQARLLVGRQPGRRLAAPLPRRRRARLAGAARARGALARRDGGRLRRPGRRTCPSACCAATAAPTCAARTRVASIDCPFTGEELAAVPALRPDVGDRPRTAGRPRRQRPALGHHRRAEGSGAGLAPLARDGRGDRGRARAAARRRRAAGLGDRPPSPWRRGGAHPSYAHGYYERDNAFYRRVGRDQPRPGRVLASGCSGTCSKRPTSSEYHRALACAGTLAR